MYVVKLEENVLMLIKQKWRKGLLLGFRWFCFCMNAACFGICFCLEGFGSCNVVLRCNCGSKACSKGFVELLESVVLLSLFLSNLCLLFGV